MSAVISPLHCAALAMHAGKSIAGGVVLKRSCRALFHRFTHVFTLSDLVACAYQACCVSESLVTGGTVTKRTPKGARAAEKKP